MRIAGGVLGIVVGVIMIIIGGLVVLGLSGAGEIADAALEGTEYATIDEALDAQEAQLEELRNTEGVTEDQITAAEQALEQARAAYADVDSVGTWYLIELIGGVLALILGIMVCASKSVPTAGLLGVVGLALTVIAILMWPGFIDLVLALITLLAGILGYMGTKQETQVPAA